MGVSSHERNTLQLEAAGMFLWLLKDLGWVVLLPAVSFPAALAAICLKSHGLLLHGGADSTALRVHGVAVLFWLLGNVSWMVAELLFEPSQQTGRQFPWFSGPIAGDNKIAYTDGRRWGQAFFACGVLVLLAYYAKAAMELRQETCQDVQQAENPQDPHEASAAFTPTLFGVVTLEVYQWVFIGPWILKDIFWTLEWLWPGLICGCVVLVLVIDYLMKFGGALFFAELLWVVGNTVWILAELAFVDNYRWLRSAAAATLGLGSLVSVFKLAQVSVACHDDLGDKKGASEHSHLLSGDSRFPRT